MLVVVVSLDLLFGFFGTNCTRSDRDNRLSMSLRPQDPLKSTLLLAFALWLCHFASGLTITYFGEDKCTTPLPSPFQGAPNPLVAPLNQCTKCFEVIAIQAPLIVAAIVTFFFSRTGRANQIAHKAHYLLVYVPLSHIHVRGCELQRDSFGPAFVHHRPLRHARHSCGLQLIHDYMRTRCRS
jgi:hypothetical protein